MKKVSNLEVGAMVYFLIRAYFVGISFNILLNMSKQLSFISIILAILLGTIYLFIYLYIFNYEPDLTINEKTIKLFGKVIGNILNIIMILVTLILIITMFANIVNIVHAEYLDKTPIFLISLYFIITIYYCTNKGIYTISKACLLILYISIMLVIACNLSLLFQTNYNNFKPILITKNTFISSIYYLSLNILPLYLINLIPKNRINKNSKTKKTIIIFYLLANITILIENINIIGILGLKLCNLYRYPEFQILKNISLIGLSSRIDSIFFIKTIFDMILFIIIGSYYIVSSIKISKKKNNIILLLYCLLLLLISMNILNISIFNIKFYKTISIITTILISIHSLLICYKIKNTKKVKS